MKKVPCIIFSRVCGYFSELNNWNIGKKQEFKDRKTYDPNKNTPHERGVWNMRTQLVEEGVLHG